MANDIGRFSKRVVQYFWDPIPRNDDPSNAPIWCLGTRYDSSPDSTSRPPDASEESFTELSVSHSSDNSWTEEKSGSSSADDSQAQNNDGDDGGWPPAFLDDFESKIWITYRSNFTPIPKSPDPKATSAMSFSVRLKSQLGNQGGFATDSGWGCMIRSGQCLLANSLLFLRFGREWRRGSKTHDETTLLALFADDPKAPFSIHKFVEHGAAACGKHPGEWFGPSATARCIQALTNSYEPAGMKVYITGDGSDIYEDSFLSIAKPSATFTPTLMLIGTRLGIDRITPVYWSSLAATLQMPQSIGIAGGRPGSSHYFIGHQAHSYFYLDPHHTRPLLPLHTNPESYTREDIDSCHTRRLRRVHVSELDPSMLIAFLIRDEDDWRAWRKEIEKEPEGSGKKVIHVADREPVGSGGYSGQAVERPEAVDEVESFDEGEDTEEGF
ncbi:peptidase family C54 [Patellaria atrata CBS 101060]|uniref:Cysteine protease n=1 Tax=Patellaria atrata CBS 101060 TaxID=1346257 RepID=A0A9P4S405_9PEZI|nr:peptidase family C54 [Patellaria atrata CBS 101060]